MTDRRLARHAATREEIVAAAWALAERDGIAGLSLRELAESVGMRAPSLYTYFESKDALYDAMFEGANRILIELFETTPIESIDPDEALVVGVERWLRFCQDSVARYQLLFIRAIPGWVPSPEAYATAEAAYAGFAAAAARAGITEQADLDLFTAVTNGLAAQQMANDPQGDRWIRLVPRAVRMCLAEIRKEPDT